MRLLYHAPCHGIGDGPSIRMMGNLFGDSEAACERSPPRRGSLAIRSTRLIAPGRSVFGRDEPRADRGHAELTQPIFEHKVTFPVFNTRLSGLLPSAVARGGLRRPNPPNPQAAYPVRAAKKKGFGDKSHDIGKLHRGQNAGTCRKDW